MMRTLAVATLTLVMPALFALQARIACADSSPAGRQIVDASPYIDRSLPDAGLQRAIDAAARHEGPAIVQLPAGTFELSAYLFLRSDVTLKGLGEQTVLKLARDEQRRSVVAESADEAARITLDGDLSELKPGTLISVWRDGANTDGVDLRHHVVQRLEGQDVILDQSYDFSLRLASRPHVSWGMSSRIVEGVERGATSVRVANPGMFRPGQAVGFSGVGRRWGHYFGLISAIDGEVLRLDRAVNVEADAGAVIHLAHCMITAFGQNNVGVEDLVIRGFEDERRSPWGGFTYAAIHIVDAEDIAIRNVSVHDWYGDGFSIQAGRRAIVENCRAIRNDGHGFHPGTRFENAVFTHLTSTHNAGDGLYFCWYNNRVNVRKSILSDNRLNGVGGLGNPGDVNNIVEENTIERNGKTGVQIIGGPNSGNVVRNNVIRDNSFRQPGQWPGILIASADAESSSGATIEGNVVESTSDSPTQWIGIEERHAAPRDDLKDRADPASGLFLVDDNRFIANRLSNHRIADLVLRGSKSVVAGGHGRVQDERRRP